jgi:hypothetical protein
MNTESGVTAAVIAAQRRAQAASLGSHGAVAAVEFERRSGRSLQSPGAARACSGYEANRVKLAVLPNIQMVRGRCSKSTQRLRGLQ